MSAEYSLAMSEVLCIINQSEDTYRNKIPHSFISFLKENAIENGKNIDLMKTKETKL